MQNPWGLKCKNGTNVFLNKKEKKKKYMLLYINDASFLLLMF